MVVLISFKTPDAVRDAVTEAAREEVARMRDEGMEVDDGFEESLVEDLMEKVGSWFADGEYCTVEVDAMADSARVVRTGRRR